MLLGKVIQSVSDKRTYRAIKLANQLQCLLVSDKDAQKSAASLSVGVGSFLDPLTSQGLAHYLEHMLFMGTSLYPSQNEYSSYLSLHGGSSNAYTGQDETNYHFDVIHDAFPGALHRFAQFFISPLMKEESSEKELNAVHSEHTKNILNDMWRKYQLSKHLSKDNHPNQKFSTGDKTTLSVPNLRLMLTNFYHSYYSANLMKLVVYGKDDVDGLQQIVNKYFTEVPNKQYTRFQLTQPPYDNKILGKVVKIVPIQDTRTLQLNFILPNKEKLYRSNPGKYASHLLGHQGKGSLLSWLISRGLAIQLSASCSDEFNCYSSFQVSITLTETGLQDTTLILNAVFQYIHMLRQQQPRQSIIREIQKVNKMKFDFLDKKEGSSYCTQLAKNMHSRPLEQLLRYPYLMDAFEPHNIQLYLSQLTPQNLFVMLSAKTYAPLCHQVEPVYKTKYCIEPLPPITPVDCNIHLPQTNIFIPQDLSVLPLGTEEYPKLLKTNDKCDAYFKADNQFALPKVFINLRLYYDGVFSIKENTTRELFNAMLTQKLREFVYMAEMANLSSSVVYSTHYHLNINIKGFRDSLANFVRSYLKEIISFEPTDQLQFQFLREKQLKKHSNFYLSNPYHIGYDTCSMALRDKSQVSRKDKLKYLPQLTLSDVVSFSRKWKQQLFAEIYIGGNLTQSNAIQLVQLVEQQIQKPLPKKDIAEVRAINLPLQKICVVEEQIKNPQEQNCALLVHFQHKQFSLRTRLMQQLIQSFIKEPAFDYLRTKEQLGYIVFTVPDDNRGVMGISLIVQSNIKHTFQLRKYIHHFFHVILTDKITLLAHDQFQQLKKSIIEKKMEKHKNLFTQSSMFWEEIAKHSYIFNRREKQIAQLPTISLEEFKGFMNGLFYTNKRVMEVHEIPAKWSEVSKEFKKQDDQYWYFSDANSFKKRMQLYPDFYSHL